MSVLQNISWLAHNANRAYPFAQDHQRTDMSGSFSLPDDFIVDLNLAINGGNGLTGNRFFLHQLTSYATGW